MKVRALIDSNLNSNMPAWLEWRILNPYQYINRIKIDVGDMWVPVGMQLDEDLDVLVVPRLVVEPIHQKQVGEWFDSIKANGTKIVYETDDDIFSPDYVTQLSRIYWNEEESIDKLIPILDILDIRRQAALWTMNQCDAVTVSVEALGNYVRTLTDKPVYVIQNALDIIKYKQGLSENIDYDNYITIGWSGGRRTEHDLDDMVEAWSRIASECVDVKFVVGGWTPKSIKNNKWLGGKLIEHEWKSTTEYASSMQVDIGCCAVGNNPFASRKSPIKSWEFSISGAAVVASKTVYENEPTILIANNAEEWYQNLMFFIKNKDARKELNTSMVRHVHSYHDLQYEYGRWIDVYNGVITNDDNKMVV